MSDALAVWTPSLRVFLRRSLIVGLTTLAVMALFGWGIGAATGFWQILYVGPVLALTYFIVVEDPARWRSVRDNRWYLRSDAVLFHGPEDDVRIPLADITDVRKRLSWSVVLFLKDGQRVRISYVSDPASVVAQILAARDRMLP